MTAGLAPLLLALCAAAGDAPAAGGGPEVGLRAAWAIPVGSVEAGEPLSRTFDGGMPLQLDGAWRLDGPLAVGLYLQYAPGRLAAPFRGAFSSSRGAVVRTGASVRWRFGPLGGALPWAGAGAGWEWALFSVTAGAAGSLRLDGPDLTVEGGAEWPLPGGRAAVGPFLSASGGWYLSARAAGGGQESSAALARRAIHGWVALGVRGSFGP